MKSGSVCLSDEPGSKTNGTFKNHKTSVAKISHHSKKCVYLIFLLVSDTTKNSPSAKKVYTQQ